MPKAVEAFRNIGEVSEELGVKKHVLRFWETRFPQLKPMKRGGGRRYYRPADVELLRGIRRLLQAEGYSVRGVQKILREGGADDVKRMGKEHIGGRRVRGRPRTSAPPLREPGAGSPPLSATDVGLLRDVVAELSALQAMLRDVERGQGADSDPKRVAARG
ncbi:MAG TPA: MerR family transcriptional regulator [Hyphomicrobiaceae bacterium]|nr:MerR family transcriptional regulator [Hyphomicrobiaceae bacterium]